MKPIQKLTLYLSVVAVVLTLIVVILGAFTRLVDAGLGCPDWPTCYGHITWPNSSIEIERAEQKFANSYPAEFAKMWPEMVHRFAAVLLGVIFVVLTFIAYQNRHLKLPAKQIYGMLALIIVQGLFGALTVTEKLHPLIVTLHLLGGFTVLSLTVILLYRLGNQAINLQWNFAFTKTRLLGLAFILLLLQISSGGWVSANYAALSCVEMPTCLMGQYFPQADYWGALTTMPEFGVNHDGGLMPYQQRVAIHIVHRMHAIITVVALLVLAFYLWQTQAKVAQSFAGVLLTLTIIQVSLGISNIVFQLPLAVAVLHNFGAALLFATVVLLWYLTSSKVLN